MRLINGADSRAMDKRAWEEYGLSDLVLMENAGLRSADFVQEKFPLSQGGVKITIVLGKGNNSGDGLVMARHLINNGYKVQLFSVYETAEFSEAAKANLKPLTAMGVEVKLLSKDRDMILFKVALISSNLIVDAIFGSGFKGELQGFTATVVEAMNGSGRPILALDIPSGVDADSGNVSQPAVKAKWTLTFALPKIGNILDPGGSYCGEVKAVDISFPPALTEARDEDMVLLDRGWALGQMAPRIAQGHKGLYGHVLALGGSRGMAGSVALAGKGALKAGSGLVTYMVPQGIQDSVAAYNMEAMTYPLPEKEGGYLAPEGAAAVIKQSGKKVLVMGMGMTRSPEITTFVQRILDGYICPLVMDADALIALGELGERKDNKHPLVLTPHPGEMARLLNCNIKDVQDRRVDSVLAAAQKYKAVTVLKGSKTLIASPQGKLLVNTTGNPGMATGGMGDVLAGIIGSFLGQGLEPLNAAALGVYFHGLAGDKAREVKGEMGLTAGDIIEYLPCVLWQYERELKEAGHVL